MNRKVLFSLMAILMLSTAPTFGAFFQPESLLNAVQSKDEGKVKEIIDRARNAGKLKEVLDERDWVGWTPLHMASGCSLVSIVRLLLQNGADVNAVDQHKSTPLHETAENRLLDQQTALETINLLVQAGAQINARDATGWTPLYLAATAKKGLPIAEALKALGAEDKRPDPKKPIQVWAMMIQCGHRPHTLPSCPYQ